jgi:AraC family transcriptional regulator, transcriptional activator of pobA
MDCWGILLHYPDMSSIPIYALYGEADDESEQDWLHWETIPARSRLHGYRIAPHRHEQFFQVLHLTGGSASVWLDGAEFDLKAPAVVVVPALTVHAYVFTPDVEGIVVTLMERDVRDHGLAFSEPAVLRAGTEAVGEALDRLIGEADRRGVGHDLAMPAFVTLLLVALNRARRELPASEGVPDRARLHADAFRWLVDQRFRQTRRIADYADALHISQTHLNRVCRQVLGTSALRIIERRIALEARRQLLFSNLPIKQIGAELGYEDPAYFTRFITRALGMAPGVYRNRARVRDEPTA